MSSRATVASLLLVLLATSVNATRPAGEGAGARVRTDDNLKPAGVLRGGVLRLKLDARPGMWRPNGDGGPGVLVPAFAEAGRAPQIPGPLIRVPAGTEVVITVTNSVPDAELTVHGLSSRPGAATAPAVPVQVPAGASKEVRFRLDATGTYYYWGTTTGSIFHRRTGADAQLAGAIVVDERGAAKPRDRIMLIGLWSDSTPSEAARGQFMRHLLLVVNGRTWPHTTRLTYTVGDTVHWRIINSSADVHPMHLHGFYYRVDARGDGTIDSTYDASRRDLVVTERMAPGTTMAMSWVPERPGNWLFHCHLTGHFTARGPLGLRLSDSAAASHRVHVRNHALGEMSGLVVGVLVAPARKRSGAAASAPAAQPRRLRLVLREGDGASAVSPLFTLALQTDGAEPAPDTTRRGGPPIVLTRGQPASITVVNHSRWPTSVHWHGIELDSYFDGVAGFSGNRGRLSPIVAPRDSFDVRFTPPRAGTFIYHTHVDEMRQQPAGLAGPLIVVEPDQRFDPATDIPVLVSSPRDPKDEVRAVLLNGTLSPVPIELRAGVRHRLRLINITTGRPGLRFELRQDTTLLAWRMLAKDGAELASERQVTKTARQTVSIGETYDVEVTPGGAGEYRLEAQTGAGVRLGVLPIRVIQ